jgi:uncharacterized membrane protein
MRSNLLVLLLTLPALSAVVCASDVAPAAGGAPTVEPAGRRLGELVLARGQLAFAPCRGVVAAAHGVDAGGEAASLVAMLNGGADGSAFLDADIARDADGRWRIERIRRAYRDGPRCLEDLGEFVWRASAGDDSWALSSSRRYVSVRRAGQPALFFRYRPFAPAGDGQWTFAARTGDTSINVVLRGKRCFDASARRLTDWSVRFTLGGAEYTGCAWSGEPG